MKRNKHMVLGAMLAICASTMASTAYGESVQTVASLYQQGVSALSDGNSRLAAECFREVLRVQPSHGNARYQLLSLSQKGPSLAAKVRKKKLTQIKIPKVNFDETSFTDALEALDIMIEKQTDGAFTPNFVIQDPHGLLDKRLVTIKLGAVPAHVVLDYMVKMANAKVRYDEHAIVLSPLGGPPKVVKKEDPQDGRDE